VDNKRVPESELVFLCHLIVSSQSFDPTHTMEVLP
jgi:hypothetical protein